MADGPLEESSLPPAPSWAQGVFGSALDTAEAFGQILATNGVVKGVIGPREVPILWERHLGNCAIVASDVPESARVADVGSGAGLPGIVWALMRPDLSVCLIEKLERRTRFLEEVIHALGLSNVEVLQARSEQVVPREFDVVTSRAVARVETLLPLTMPLVAQDGVMLAIKGQSVADEVAACLKRFNTWGLSGPLLHEYGVGDGSVDGPTAYGLEVGWRDGRRVSSPLLKRTSPDGSGKKKSSRRRTASRRAPSGRDRS